MEEQSAPQGILDKPGGILGIGCLLLLSIGAIGAGVLGWMGYQMLAANENPEKRLEVAKAILSTESLPAGLHAVAAMSMRGSMDFVVLSDEPFLAGEDTGHFKNEGLVFMRVKGASMGAMPGEFEEEFLKGEYTANENDLLMPSMRDGRSYESGNFQHHGAKAKFSILRGTLEVFGWRGPGIQARFSVRCSKTATPALGVWFMKDRLGNTNIEQSPLHVPALGARLENINFCPNL